MACTKEHRYDERFLKLPDDQGGAGRHKCCACAYENGFSDGRTRKEILDINLDQISNSQAGTVRHKSPHAAYALGYYDGVVESYNI